MRFESKPIAEHDEVPTADDGRWDALIHHWDARQPRPHDAHAQQNACYVVSVTTSTDAIARRAQLDEILGLVGAQRDKVMGHETRYVPYPDPRTLLGHGACAAIAQEAANCGADLLVIDAELSPSQMRNLEDATGLAVSCREAVILNVFQQHARTARARIQVEIAHLAYLRPRIRGIGLTMDQQAGGVMGSRGPGETASAMLARRLDRRMAELRRDLVRLQRAAAVQRKGREGCLQISLVGYTNAGKTTLMNALTGANLSAKDVPFETLDTTSRCLTRHGGDILVSDTVGVIRRLPERLMGSFESTLAVVEEASLLVLVVDVSDPEWELHLRITEDLLVRLGVEGVPRFYVFNKVDKIPEPPLAGILLNRSHGHPFMALSCEDTQATAALRHTLIAEARRGFKRERVFVEYDATGLLDRVYAQCRVVHTRATDRGLRLIVEGPSHVVASIKAAGQAVTQ